MKLAGLKYYGVCQGPCLTLQPRWWFPCWAALIRCKWDFLYKMVCELTIERKYAEFEDYIKGVHEKCHLRPLL